MRSRETLRIRGAARYSTEYLVWGLTAKIISMLHHIGPIHGKIPIHMKAAVYTKAESGKILEIKDLDQPIPKDKEVVLSVRAASVNPLDWRMKNPAARSGRGWRNRSGRESGEALEAWRCSVRGRQGHVC